MLSNTGAYPSEGAPDHPQKLDQTWQACMDKRFSLLPAFVNYDCKKLYNIGSWFAYPTVNDIRMFYNIDNKGHWYESDAVDPQ